MFHIGFIKSPTHRFWWEQNDIDLPDGHANIYFTRALDKKVTVAFPFCVTSTERVYGQ